MPIFLANYDLNKERSRPPIVKVIRENWNFAKISESSYAVEATSLNEVHDTLMPMIDKDDSLFVFVLKKPYRGWGPPEVHDWLEKKLTY